MTSHDKTSPAVTSDPAEPAAVLERPSKSEAEDIEEIVRGMLAIQAQAAAAQERPLSRGTHAKGTCVRAEFEVYDLSRTPGNPSLAERRCDSRTPTAGIETTACVTSGQCPLPWTSHLTASGA